MSWLLLAKEASVHNHNAVDLGCQPEIEISHERPKFCDTREDGSTPSIHSHNCTTHYLGDGMVSISSATITRSGHHHRIITYADDILVVHESDQIA